MVDNSSNLVLKTNTYFAIGDRSIACYNALSGGPQAALNLHKSLISKAKDVGS
jgi:hypothetical protein